MPFGVPWPRQAEVVVVVPEDAGIALMHQDERVGENLVVDDLVAAHVVVLDKGDGVEGPFSDDRAIRGQVAQIVVQRVADILQLVAQRKVEGGDLVIGDGAHAIEPASMSSGPDQYSPTTNGVNSLPSRS